jgi:hypothetical protein
MAISGTRSRSHAQRVELPLDNVSNETRLSRLAALVATDRHTTADLLAHVAEVDARGLYLPVACSSMHVYCTRVLHFSDDAAYKRIRAARLARRVPQILAAIADDRVHLAGGVLLAPHVTGENVDELLVSATHRSKAEIEMLVARIAPKPMSRPRSRPCARLRHRFAH